MPTKLTERFGQGASGFNDGTLKTVLTELQHGAGQRMSVVAGAAANTNIAVAGIAAGDVIIGICNLTDAATVALTGLVVTDGNIKVAAATTDKTLLVLWVKVPV